MTDMVKPAAPAAPERPLCAWCVDAAFMSANVWALRDPHGGADEQIVSYAGLPILEKLKAARLAGRTVLLDHYQEVGIFAALTVAGTSVCELHAMAERNSHVGRLHRSTRW